ncbi:MAG: hypothetical protein A2070_00870 [Bdellovibrionales bacterium GWC1_52_8]|nr:MAG: hypothetical protein A2Z97_06790 [Bdellovibrionales bacterium GWB1_52_6]OFZ05484.1 MAG: hypothetical protein A2X97_11450 [Bdellovibrionales bacterium GWA1_52_35]OFZ38416.1 MAG: hypothetical protein A2070_00870 [Bdellovibrionales bacterium GWC1_52_8]HCM39151.1 serine/threonine protein phosphatase [Bdellovibrionales bacterium]
MNLRFLIFISIMGSILAAASYYLGRRTLAWIPWAQKHPVLIWVAVSAFVILQIGGPLLYRHFPSRTSWPFVLQWITYGTLGLFTAFLFYTLISDLVIVLWSKLLQAPPDLERRAFIAVGIAAFASWGIGIFQALKRPSVYEISVPIKGLAPEFEGYRIVQITDTHIGPILGKDFVEGIVSIANGLDADAIALTGDLIDGTVSDLRVDTALLRNLKARDGVFFITGNHEYYWGAQEWISEIASYGIRPLMNEHVVLTRGKAQLVLAGTPDVGADKFFPEHRFNPKKALEGAPTEAVKVLFTHRPTGYEEIEASGFNLMLAGHTHGGQFLPWSVLVAIAHRYHIGLNRFKNLWIYVSRGTGFWGPPVRFTVPSEISLLRLTGKTIS